MIICTTRTTGASSLAPAASSWAASRRSWSRASKAWTWLPTSRVAPGSCRVERAVEVAVRGDGRDDAAGRRRLHRIDARRATGRATATVTASPSSAMGSARSVRACSGVERGLARPGRARRPGSRRSSDTRSGRRRCARVASSRTTPAAISCSARVRCSAAGPARRRAGRAAPAAAATSTPARPLVVGVGGRDRRGGLGRVPSAATSSNPPVVVGRHRPTPAVIRGRTSMSFG